MSGSPRSGSGAGEPNTDNLYELSAEEIARRGIKARPATLLQAVEELAEDEALRSALGKTPDGDYIDYFAKVKQEEFLGWSSVASVGGRALSDVLLGRNEAVMKGTEPLQF